MVAGIRLYATFDYINEHVRNKIENPDRYGTFFPIKVEVKDDMTVEVLLVADILDPKCKEAELDRCVKWI